MKDIFTKTVSPSGELACIIQGDKSSVWMYLQDLISGKIIGDVPVCSRKHLISLAEFKATYEGKGMPPLVISYSSSDAVMKKIEAGSFVITWATDENHVDVNIGKKVVSRIEKGKDKGLSIFTLKEGPWGSPWEPA